MQLCMVSVVVLAVLLGTALGVGMPWIWPLPTAYFNGTEQAILSARFAITTSSQSAVVLGAITRYNQLIFVHRLPSTLVQSPPNDLLTELHIDVSSTDETLQMGTDESYTLLIPTSGRASITAKTVYGALRAIETFSQLVTFDFLSHQYVVQYTPWTINDAPLFAHRGLLVDSSRHFEPIPTMRQVIDAMSYIKMNVLHWHVVDMQAFPLEFLAYPHLWDGAYSWDARYTQQDVRDLVEYARLRGVRVMVEFDVPGHAASWCTGYPGICPAPSCTMPLDPSVPLTYQVINAIITESSAMFPEQFFHLGGDEVDTSCWTNTPRIAQWMTSMNLTADGAYLYIVKKAHQFAISQKRSPVCWEEVFKHFGTALPAETVVDVWLDKTTLKQVVAAGYRAILSQYQAWYLDWLATSFDTMYDNDPLEGITDPKQRSLVLGGEACMWGETVDTSDIMQTIFPRLCAVAERLWSTRAPSTSVTVKPRAHWIRCLLNSRGIAAAPMDNAQAREAPPAPGGCYDQ